MCSLIFSRPIQGTTQKGEAGGSLSVKQFLIWPNSKSAKQASM